MVSVIVPVYNGAAMVEQCLRSILNQTITELEVIVVDDGSTDDTNAICERIAQEDPRVSLIRQKNSGVSVARNKGIANANGEYIAFVDADDYLPKNGVELMLAAMDDDTDWVVGSYQAFRRGYSRKIMRENRRFSATMVRESFEDFDAFMNTVWAKLYKKNIIQQYGLQFDNQLPYSEDNVFNLEYCKRARNTALIEGVVYCYRLGGIASSIKYHPQWNKYCLLLMHAYDKFFEGNALISSQYYKKKISTQITSSFAHYMLHCARQEKDHKIAETLQMYAPFFQKDAIDEFDFSPRMAKAITDNDVNGIKGAMFCQMGLRLIIRKMKILFYQWFKKRL